MIGSNYTIKKLDTKTAKEYIHKHHYSRGSHNSPSPCYGLYDNGKLIGVCMFACPCSENVRKSVLGEKYKNSVIELHRLHILDITPRNMESWFIARCLKLLKEEKPHIKVVISFADSTEGHCGTIYKATNFYRAGKTNGCWFYVDKTGRLRHPRQNGRNIKLEEAKKLGWERVYREGKYRYIKPLYKDKKERKEIITLLEPYLVKHKSGGI